MDSVQSVKRTTGEPYRAVCRELDVSYSSLMRWQHRRQAGAAVVLKPGPAKVGPLDLEALESQIRQLAHGRERTRGTGALYVQHREAISRRDLQALEAEVRGEVHRDEQALSRHVEWLVPGLVWSMDDADAQRLDTGRSHLHVVHDLGSQYTLRVLGNEVLADGWTIARNLVELFESHGAPLFFKRDNGSNLNHAAITRMFGEYGVIPLNSPPHYPPYNGGMERKQREIKEQLARRLGVEPTCLPVLTLAAEVCGHELNHKRRRHLGGRTACRVLDEGRPFLKRFHLRERKEVFEAIKALAVDITERLEQHTDCGAETAFRYAAETWMQSNNMIRVSRNGQVLPPFYRFRSH